MLVERVDPPVGIDLPLGQQSAALQLKLGYVYLAVPLAGVFISFYTIIFLIEALRGEAEVAQQSSGLN